MNNTIYCSNASPRSQNTKVRWEPDNSMFIVSADIVPILLKEFGM